MSDIQNEIIWKLKRRKNFALFYSHITYLSLLCACLYILFVYFIAPKNWKDYVGFLGLIFCICYIAREFYYSFNLKTMYIKNNHLFIEKYLGGNIVLPLGNFIVFQRTYFHANFMLISKNYIESINKHSLFPLYLFLESFNTNIDEIQTLLKPYIADYLLKCNEKAYIKFKTFYQEADVKEQYGIDYKEIDKLREEQSND